MPVEFVAATPIEVYTITAADYAVAVGVGFLLILLAVALTALVLSPERSEPTTPVEADAPEAVKTVELPRRSGPRTGTIHAPQYRRSEDDTVVIKPAETRR